MHSHSRMALRTLAALFVLLTACASESSAPTGPTARGGADRTGSGTGTSTGTHVTVGSFDFAESELLAELYSQALEGGGYTVRRAFNLGPREFVAPALARGLVDLVPEYAGTALQFVSLGRALPAADPAATRQALLEALRDTGVTALDAAPAQDANAFVATRATADRLGLTRLSDLGRLGDLAGAGPSLILGGPPECASRPLCALGLERVYGARFGEVVALDAGGPLTLQALRTGVVDVALLFTSDPAIADEAFVQLADDKALQPAENIVPLVRTAVLEGSGPRLAELVDAVSRNLTTDDLRGLNRAVAGGGGVGAVAAGWLAEKGVR